MSGENKLKAGVSGTQSGWTEAQRTQFTLMVSEMAIGEWHQGDCVGVDEQSTEVVAQIFGRDILHTHPPVNPKKRANVSARIGHLVHLSPSHKVRQANHSNSTKRGGLMTDAKTYEVKFEFATKEDREAAIQAVEDARVDRLIEDDFLTETKERML